MEDKKDKIVLVIGSEKPQQAKQVFGNGQEFAITNPRVNPYQETFIEKPRKKRRQDLFKK